MNDIIIHNSFSYLNIRNSIGLAITMKTGTNLILPLPRFRCFDDWKISVALSKTSRQHLVARRAFILYPTSEHIHLWYFRLEKWNVNSCLEIVHKNALGLCMGTQRLWVAFCKGDGWIDSFRGVIHTLWTTTVSYSCSYFLGVAQILESTALAIS